MSRRTNLPRYPAVPVLFVETFLINPDTGKSFDLLDHERELLRSPRITDFAGRLAYINEEFKYRPTSLAAIYLITTLVLFRDAKPEVFCGSCDRVNHEFDVIKRIVESSPLLRAQARISPDKIMIAGSVVMDHNQLYAHIED